PSPDVYQTLIPQVESGRVAEADIDKAVARVLRAKFLARLFEQPSADGEQAERQANAPAHQALALDAARKTIVLLKNDGNLLPFDRSKIKTLAVIGPNAKGVRL